MKKLIFDRPLTKRPRKYVSLELCYDTGNITYQKYQRIDKTFIEETYPLKVPHLIGQPDEDSFETAISCFSRWITNDLNIGNNLSIFVILIVPQKYEPEIKLLMISAKLKQIAKKMPFADIKFHCKLIRSVDELTNAEKDTPIDYSVEMAEFFLQKNSVVAKS